MPRQHSDINFPKPIRIMARSSSITNAFVNGIVPNIPPTSEEVKAALSILEMNEDDVRCAYCGDEATEWDHLNPLIEKTRDTGYITEIANLVPSCGRCNQSKGNKNWKTWMKSTARLSPSNRKISDLGKRIERIEKYESTFSPKKVDLKQYVSKEKWEKYWEDREQLILYMRDANSLAAEIRKEIKDKLEQEKTGSKNSERHNSI